MDVINLISCFSDNIHLPASSKAWTKPLPSINFPMTLTHRTRYEVLPYRTQIHCECQFDEELQVKRDNGLSVFKDTILYLLSLFHSCIEVFPLSWTSINNWQHHNCGNNRFYTKKGTLSSPRLYI